MKRVEPLQLFFIKYFYRIIFFVIVFLGLQHVATYGINTSPDTLTYFTPHSIDSLISVPLYPLFLVCYKFLFGTNHLLFLGLIQVVFGCIAITYSLKKLEEFVGLNKFFILLVLCIYVKFYFWYGYYDKNYFPAYGFYGNWVLTEALTYPLFLIFIPYFINAVIRLDKKSFVKSAVILTLLLLARNQMQFLLPVYCLLIVHMMIKKKFRLAGYSVVCLLIIVSFVSLSTRLWHYSTTGQFVGSTLKGSQVLAPTLFLMNKDDVSLFSGDKKILINKMYEEMKEKNTIYKGTIDFNRLLFSALFQSRLTPQFYTDYVNSISSIMFSTLQDNFKQQYGQSMYSIEANKVFSEIAYTLIYHNFDKNIKAYTIRALTIMNKLTYMNSLFFLLLALFMLLFYFYNYQIASVGLLILAACFSNVMVLSIAQLYDARMVSYTNVVNAVFYIILFQAVLRYLLEKICLLRKEKLQHD